MSVGRDMPAARYVPAARDKVRSHIISHAVKLHISPNSIALRSNISQKTTLVFQNAVWCGVTLVARLTTAAIVQRRGCAAACRRIPRLCTTKRKVVANGRFPSSLRRGIVRLRFRYPRLGPIAAVVSRATGYCGTAR